MREPAAIARPAAAGPVVRVAPAKVNLTLAVLGRREDGYHALHSIMAPLALGDTLSVAPAAGPEDSLHVAGHDAGPVADNLVLRAIALAREKVGRAAPTPPLAARLEKRIPVAAGLAGGSSDAAAALDAALEAWGTELSPAGRVAVAARLGSDVPFFLAGGIALVEGRGERVTPLRGVVGGQPGILLVTAATVLSTAAVFAAFAGGGEAEATDHGATLLTSQHLAAELGRGLGTADLVARAGVLASANDLANAATVLLPELRSFRRALLRRLARPVGLSGSGPTLWALYPSEDAAAEAARGLQAAFDAGELLAPGDGPPHVVATRILASTTDTSTGRDHG